MSGDRKNNDIFNSAGGNAGERAKMTGMPVRNTMKDDFGLEIPTELVPLPSCGKVYPDHHPLHGQEAVEIRPMTAREEDILTSRALIKKGTVITELIRSCLINKSINLLYSNVFARVRTCPELFRAPLDTFRWMRMHSDAFGPSWEFSICFRIVAKFWSKEPQNWIIRPITLTAKVWVA